MFKTADGFTKTVKGINQAIERALDNSRLIEMSLGGLFFDKENHPTADQIEILHITAIETRALLAYAVKLRDAEMEPSAA